MTIPLGELISLVYERFLKLYGDEELASVAAAVVINEVLASSKAGRLSESAA